MSMAAPDLEVIKDIPGYKVILKAVIKAQIQQLVEQLAAHTDEESVILTASVSDGTLSHLGSDSGKGFLEEQEDVKTQFLGFCLKRHHKKLQAEKEKERQLSMVQAPLPGQFDMGPGQRRPRLPYQPGPRFSQQGYIRSSGARHEPYRIPRSGRRPSSETSFTETSQGPVSTQGLGSNMENIPMKTEPSDDIQNSDSLNKDDDNTNSSISTVTNDQSESRTGDNTGNLDSDSVKVEAISESEFELEITGVEPGRAPVPQDNWDPNVSMGMNFDPSQGASGSPGDMSSQQGYNNLPKRSLNGTTEAKHLQKKFQHQSSTPQEKRTFVCQVCKKSYGCLSSLRRHSMVHISMKPFKCEICGKFFSYKENPSSYGYLHTEGGKKFKCSLCEESLTRKRSLRHHSVAIHAAMQGTQTK